MPLADGQSFAGYTILRHLGSGGMGEIYLAQHPDCRAMTRSRCSRPRSPTTRSTAQRFNREADIAATLWHPHIVGVHDRGEFEGQLWISMDYVEGTDAARLLQEQYPNGMPPDEVVRIVTAVGEALDYAHQRQLLHRDVKPANILISHADSGDERIMLADFGIARWVDDASGLTGTNMTVGTVAYAAPEQLMGEQLDGRADQYALAATAYHLLTGTPLFQHSNPAVVISQHLSAARHRPSAPAGPHCRISARCSPRRCRSRPPTATTPARSSRMRSPSGSAWWPQRRAPPRRPPPPPLQPGPSTGRGRNGQQKARRRGGSSSSRRCWRCCSSASRRSRSCCSARTGT